MACNNILLIGYGSVAKNYAKAAKSFGKTIYYYDVKNKETSDANFFDIMATYDQDKTIEFDTIIFCDYASSRVKNYKNVRKFKTKRFVFEKLISNNLKEINYLRNEQNKSRETEFKTHLRWNLLGVDKKIIELQQKYDLGSLLQMSVNAGNCCLSMGGAHWIGLFLKLFNVNSIEKYYLQSNIDIKYESPRGRDIPVLSGIISLFFEKQLNLSLNFFPNSHVAPLTTFLFKYGRIIMNFDGELSIQTIEGDRHLSRHVYKVPMSIQEKYSIVSSDKDPFRILLGNEIITPDFDLGLLVCEIIICAIKNNNNSVMSVSKIKNQKGDVTLNIT